MVSILRETKRSLDMVTHLVTLALTATVETRAFGAQKAKLGTVQDTAALGTTQLQHLFNLLEVVITVRWRECGGCALLVARRGSGVLGGKVVQFLVDTHFQDLQLAKKSKMKKHHNLSNLNKQSNFPVWSNRSRNSISMQTCFCAHPAALNAATTHWKQNE